MNRRRFVQSGTLAGVALMAAAAAEVEKRQEPASGAQSVKFAQVADVHMVGFTVQQGLVCPRLPLHAPWLPERRYDLMGYVLPLALEHISEALCPDFVFLSGDQVEDGFGSHGQADLRQLKTVVDEHTKPPAYFAYGNHDGPQGQWAELHGPLNYTFDVRDTRFVVLNSGSMNPGAEQESSWVALGELERAIATADGRRLVVLLHQWIVPPDVPGYSIVRAEEMKQALEAYPGAVAVINGHYHGGRYSEINGIHYCTARALCEPPLCFCTYELIGHEMVWTEYRLSGERRGFAPATSQRLPLRTAG